ncbi:AAA family ATPase [Salinisphaera sp. Q1T1-3]|uniref:AAA family ATPase n=1 Tax=Salinisphaera sp. Q1T1-3 TaxID=2321229 RepID=UPI000E70E762|nr:AAA family ATPase [Salinisphaera sp. Q1T1-3]RJS95214.1 hypothetical protein D3260_01255 [Salinisphaera sp. Q1T1-3]
MIARVALFGFESTGKTTLASALAAHFNAPWSAEYVRGFFAARDGHVTAADLPMIARGQIANEEAAAARATDLVFCDTDLLTHRLWVDLLFPGRCPPWVRSMAPRRATRFALYLYCDIDMPWVDDGQRTFARPSERARLAERWQAALAALPVPSITLRGDFETRFARAVTAVEALRRGDLRF